MIIEILDQMLLAYYTLNFKQPSKIVMNIKGKIQKQLESELKGLWTIHEYEQQCKYKGIPLEYNIREDFISLEE